MALVSLASLQSTSVTSFNVRAVTIEPGPNRTITVTTKGTGKLRFIS